MIETRQTRAFDNSRVGKSQRMIAKLEGEKKRTDYAAQQRASAAAVEATEITRKTLLGYLKTLKTLQRGSQSMPFTILFITFFLSAALLHAEVERISDCQQAIRHILTERDFASGGQNQYFANIAVIDDVWAWLDQTLVPYLYSDDSQNFNILIGNPEIRQSRANKKACTINKLADMYGDCHPMTSLSTSDFGPAAPNGTSSTPDINLPGFVYDHKKKNFYFTLQGNASLGQVGTQLQAYQSNNWLDESTTQIEVEFILLNSEYSLANYVHVTLEFIRGGDIRQRLGISTFHVSWYLHLYSYILDTLWLGCIFLVVVSELSDLRELRVKKRTALYLEDKWNIFDWLQVMYSVSIITYWLVVVGWTHLLKVDLENLENPFSDVFDPTFASQFLDDVRDLSWHLLNVRIIVATNVFILIARLFKAFHTQPRLATVTHTFTLATVDLTHFLIVVVTIWLCFVTSGMVLFGPGVELFSEFQNASTACLRLMLGETPIWFQIYEYAPAATAAWFWTFWVIVVLVLLNILIAIIIDQYTYVKSTIGKDAPAIWNQIATSWFLMFLYVRGKVDMNKVFRKVQDGELRRHTVISYKELQVYGQMSEYHALRLILVAKQWEDSKLKIRGYSLTDALAEIPVALDRFNSLFFRIRQGETKVETQMTQILHLREQVKFLLERVEGTEPTKVVAPRDSLLSSVADLHSDSDIPSTA